MNENLERTLSRIEDPELRRMIEENFYAQVEGEAAVDRIAIAEAEADMRGHSKKHRNRLMKIAKKAVEDSKG